ncbi:hypothetical protein DY000_02010264 [Brassica cretica]|uniref:Uncharacterized protein n=1 Tax=Brassica cretica TaxID=69181 RepID=A0ABQ7BQL6_BRACR|nr:hypothetical protein DY000_02010264 [Brassica cretica]
MLNDSCFTAINDSCFTAINPPLAIDSLLHTSCFTAIDPSQSTSCFTSHHFTKERFKKHTQVQFTVPGMKEATKCIIKKASTVRPEK